MRKGVEWTLFKIYQNACVASQGIFKTRSETLKTYLSACLPKKRVSPPSFSTHFDLRVTQKVHFR